ncbi:heparinase II/III domain-containing protein [Halomonas caseinilytica]|uniref:heparinase II/III domain-containing protein n=1 Tax=Halomonas caseinilytica TaxID=438744 RepID=UPI00147E5747|nr:heparinase II/III family protein [Halomonas caseinilytica]
MLFDVSEIQELRAALESQSLPARYREQVRQDQARLRPFLGVAPNIPGQGEAGGAEHAQHKQNYQLLHLASQLWLLTERPEYLAFVRALLLGYVDIYESLPSHVSKDSNPPGKLFHQCLNESMWLLYGCDAYSNVKAQLSAEEQRHIEQRLFVPMVELIADHNADDFDVIHNHGIWSVAAAAFAGLVLKDATLVRRALYGNAGDGVSGGFYAQLDRLFSPDGYYLEGPYYHRFALRPMILLAEALKQNAVDEAIHEYRDGIIGKAIRCLFELTFEDGRFIAINDSSKTMGLTDEGAILGAMTLAGRYGQTDLPVALRETLASPSTTLPYLASLRALARTLEENDAQGSPRGSRFIADGASGDQGGIGVLRASTEAGHEAMAYLSFGQHGSDPNLHSALDHGHFDGLHLGFYNGRHESLTDYGFCRWVNIEPKFGGRYTPENKSYAKQTVAHNTLVVDESSQHGLSTPRACDNHGELVHAETTRSDLHGISARLTGYYDGVELQRSVLLLNLPEVAEPLLVDIQCADSDQQHRYDSPLHFMGQIMTTYPRLAPLESPHALGEANGYQHLWKLAESDALDPDDSARVTWLNDDTFTTAHICASNPVRLVHGLIGAADPDNNLRNEPYLMARSAGRRQVFATLIETHGYFNEAREISRGARPSVDRIAILFCDETQVVVSLTLDSGKRYRLAAARRESGPHEVTLDDGRYRWNGWFDLSAG